MIAGRLTMRALVERNQAIGKDGWGNPVAPSFQPLATLRCFVWSNNSRKLIDGDKTAMLQDMRALFALSADIRENDEIAAVTNVGGETIIAGRLRVDGPVQRKHTHLEAALKRIG